MTELREYRQPLGENQQQWVDVLRSGEYKQAKNTLQNCDRFCCLGVACKVAQKNNVYVSTYEDNAELIGANLFSQEDVENWLGGISSLGRPYGDGAKSLSSLTEYNDNKNYTFKQIADHLEKYAEYYFKEVK